MIDKISFLGHCRELVSDKIMKLKADIKAFDTQAGDETKSSAGDKYETSVAMLHLEKEKMASQLNEALKLQKAFSGSENAFKLIFTDSGIFFLAGSLGKVRFENQDVFVLSPAAPLGQLLAKAQEGEPIQLNGKTYLTERIV